jgi:hypothetical protein
MLMEHFFSFSKNFVINWFEIPSNPLRKGGLVLWFPICEKLTQLIVLALQVWKSGLEPQSAGLTC